MGGSGDRGETGDQGASVSVQHSHTHTLIHIHTFSHSREIWECEVLMEKKERWDQVEKKVSRYVIAWSSHCTSSIKHMLMHVP